MIQPIRSIPAQRPSLDGTGRHRSDARAEGGDARRSEGARRMEILPPAGSRVTPRGTDEAAFLAHLAALEVGGGDRRLERQPAVVAVRAMASYRRADRLGSDLELGFFAGREA